MSTDPSYHDSNALTRQVYQAMERAGIDAEAFMAELGLSPEAIEQRDRRRRNSLGNAQAKGLRILIDSGE